MPASDPTSDSNTPTNAAPPVAPMMDAGEVARLTGLLSN